MKKSIGKPYERKVHVRFDEGGADILYSTLILKEIRTVECQALLYYAII